MERIFKFFTDSTNPKEKFRKLTSLIILVLLLAFVYIFFDVLIDENAKASIIVLFVLYILIKEIITDFDVLYSGNPEKNKYVRAFKANLPSKYIMETNKISQDEALKLWYKEFNQWKDKDHKMHENWQITLDRGFKCRMVYFIIITFRFIAILSTVLTLAIFLIYKFNVYFNMPVVDNYIRNHSNLTIPIVFVLICFIIYILFLIINYPSLKKPRGCFLRFNEINTLNIGWLKENLSVKEDQITNDKKDNNNA